MGGILTGPVAHLLISRYNLKGEPRHAGDGRAGHEIALEERRPLSPESFLETVLLIMAGVAVGGVLSTLVKIPGITLPTFVWCLFTGIIIRNIFIFTLLYKCSQLQSSAGRSAIGAHFALTFRANERSVGSDYVRPRPRFLPLELQSSSADRIACERLLLEECAEDMRRRV